MEPQGRVRPLVGPNSCAKSGHVFPGSEVPHSSLSSWAFPLPLRLPWTTTGHDQHTLPQLHQIQRENVNVAPTSQDLMIFLLLHLSQLQNFIGEIGTAKISLMLSTSPTKKLYTGNGIFSSFHQARLGNLLFANSHACSKPTLMPLPLNAWHCKLQWSCPLYFSRNLIRSPKRRITPNTWHGVYSYGLKET